MLFGNPSNGGDTMEPLQPQYSYLKQLDLDLQNHKKDSIFLKIVGSQDDRHVEVVKGGFWNFVATIASFLGFKKYDLTEISRVFNTQLQQLETKYDNALADQNYAEIEQTATRIATFFAEQLKKESFIKNFATDKELACTFASWKAPSQFHELFTKSTKTQDELEAVYTYIFKKMLDIDSPKLSAASLTDKKERSREITRDVISVVSSKFIGKGITSKAALLGSVAEENTRCIHDIFNQNLTTDMTSEELGATLVETSCILVAHTGSDENQVVALQAKRALLLLLLQELTRKIGKEADFDETLKGETAHVRGHFSPIRLFTIQDDELNTIRAGIEKQARLSPGNDNLLSELDSHFTAYNNAKSQAVSIQPTILKESGEKSLTSSLYKRINDNWKRDIAPLELTIIAHQDILPFAKNAVQLLKLRELLFAAQKYINATKSDASKKERRVLKNIETQIKPLWDFVAGPGGYQDSENKSISKKRLMTISALELSELKSHILQALKPLHSSLALDKTIQWQQLSVYERELKQIFVTQNSD